MGLVLADLAALHRVRFAQLMAQGSTPAARARLVTLMIEAQGSATYGDCALDETMDEIRSQMRRFTEDKVAPNAHQWHSNNDYVRWTSSRSWPHSRRFLLGRCPRSMAVGARQGVMCVVSEELSRGWIAVGSLGTRAEIACELILGGGTEEQKQKWLPRIGSGEILPTAVFTEPNTGSDLGSLRTRAVKHGDVYRVTGNKTWITHPVRADVMTLLARTNPDEPGYKGLSMFLAGEAARQRCRAVSGQACQAASRGPRLSR